MLYEVITLAKVRLLQKKPQMAIPLVKQLMQADVNDPEVAKLKAGCEAQVAAQSKEARPKNTPIKTRNNFV